MSNNDLTVKALVNTYYDSSAKKLYQINSDGTVGGEIKMGANVDLNFSTPLYSMLASNSNRSYTATKDCYLMGSIGGGDVNSVVNININDTPFVLNTNGPAMTFISSIKLNTGDNVTVSTIGSYPKLTLQILEEK